MNTSRSPMFLYGLFLILLFAAGCQERAAYRESASFPAVGWTWDDPAIFDFAVSDTAATYDLRLTFAFDPEYPYQNIYYRTHTIFPNGDTIVDLVNTDLADKAGEWMGPCRGSSCQMEIPLQEGFSFQTQGEYQIAIEQFTRKDTVPLMRSLTLALSKTK